MNSLPRLLVTGAGGQLGQDVVRAAAQTWNVIGFGSTELDVCSVDRVRELVLAARPDAIVHCAAYTNVDGAEQDRETAFAVNEGGTANVAAAAHEVGAHLTAVSTDYVFAGQAATGYAEDAATAPINVYGESKLAGERAALALPGACVARTSWLFGTRGTNFVRTIATLALDRGNGGEPLRVVADQHGCPTFTEHLAASLLHCAGTRTAGVVHLVGTPPTTWHALAVATVEALGIDLEVLPVSSSEFPRPAPRPANSVLISTRDDIAPVGDWRVGVEAIAAQLAAAAAG